MLVFGGVDTLFQGIFSCLMPNMAISSCHVFATVDLTSFDLFFEVKVSTYIVYSIDVNMNFCIIYIYIYSHVISTVYIYVSISVNHGDQKIVQ